MLDKDKLLSHIEQSINILLNTEIYQKYLSFQKTKLELTHNYSSIQTLLQYNEFLTETDIQNIHIIEYLMSHNKIVDEEEIKAIVQNISDHTNQEVETIKQKYAQLEKLKELIVTEYIPNTINEIIDTIKECYQQKLISIEDAIKLTLYVNYINSKKYNIVPEEQKKTIIITKNAVKIDYSELYKANGYDYEKIGKYSRNKLELYGKEENVSYVLNFLNHYLQNDKDIFPTYSKLVVDLIVYFDKETIDNLSKFLDNNDINILELMKRGSVFFKENIEYTIKNENGNTIEEQYQSPKGEYDNFLEYIQNYKKSNGLADDYRIKDKDLITIFKYFQISIQELNKNIQLVKKYGLTGQETVFNGEHIEYILDRCIELGLLDYVKRFPSFLNGPNFPFKFYKIKRALDLRESIYGKTGGLRSELSSDIKPFNGINWETDSSSNCLITQEEMSMDDLVRGKKDAPEYYDHRYTDNPYESARKVFEHFYKYRVFTPTDIFKYEIQYEEYPEMGKALEEAFKDDYKIIDYSQVENPLIDILDNFEGELGPLKVDDCTYSFSKKGKNQWKDTTIIISRHKVIRLCTLLQNIKIDLNNPISENIILSILVKDSVLSLNELYVMRNCVKDILRVHKEKSRR